MELREQRRDGALIVIPVGRIDSNTSVDLEQRVVEAAGAGEARVVVDMGGVEYISSAGLRVLLLLAKRLEPGGRLALCAMQEPVREVFALAGFTAIFTVTADLEAALAHVNTR